MTGHLGLELLDPLDELRALAPDRLEAVGDVVHHPVDGALAVSEQAALELDVPDLYGCEWHDDSLLLYSRRPISPTSRRWTTMSVMTATIGDRSSGPSDGSRRRKMRM